MSNQKLYLKGIESLIINSKAFYFYFIFNYSNYPYVRKSDTNN